MALAAWIRDRLWRADSWCAELANLRQLVATEPRTARTLERTFDLACATAYCDPDRGRALALYLDAWRGGFAGAREPARLLAADLRAHLTLAEIALADGELGAAGEAFLDAGFPELALAPLKQVVEARPPGASAATESVRLDGVRTLVSLAGRRRVDGEREIADSLARAHGSTGRAAAAAYLHAARVARLVNLDDRIPAILAAATRACPDDDAIAALVETRLLDHDTGDDLLAYYRARAERTDTRAGYVESVRAAGVELIARNLHPGLGLRLLRMGLEHAYAALLPEVTSHIAAWELLTTHARAQGSTLELVPLIVQGLAAPLSEDDALYLGRLGLEIAWRDASDTLAAQPYAAMVLDFVADHPLATAFAREVAAAEPDPAPAPAAPAPAPVLATPPRMPSTEDGMVPRSAVSPSAAVKPHGISGRLALLRPPPPRATSLRRDTSPFPISRRPAKPTVPRAPRVVVPLDVVIELPSGVFFSTVLRDVSTSGAFIMTKRELELGTVVSLELRIPTPGTLTQVRYRTNARIARRTDVGCGLAFVEASPELVAAIRAATA